MLLFPICHQIGHGVSYLTGRVAVEQVVDYRGFRVSMTQELPLSDNTLLYGSVDAGQTVRADPQVAPAVEELAAMLVMLPKTTCVYAYR